jgi:hypothetical protein
VLWTSALKGWSPAPGTVGRWWDLGTLAPASPSLLLPGHHELNSFLYNTFQA